MCRLSVRPLAAIAASNASSAERAARSPIACTCTCQPAASAAVIAGFATLGSQ